MKTEIELEALEAKGVTCKDCIHYDVCGLGTTVLCFAFEAGNDDKTIADNMRDYWKHQRCGAE